MFHVKKEVNGQTNQFLDYQRSDFSSVPIVYILITTPMHVSTCSLDSCWFFPLLQANSFKPVGELLPRVYKRGGKLG